MGMEELEARIKRLEDIEEIKKLKATYAILCDGGLDKAENLNEMLSHYTDDAAVDFGL
ncbi:MAG: nuclear transport factor 2 family protein [Deltaproteobacteria bacterium]|nr:nuclear transport factor 2 family protein [Deltaproteobacteria bacterium]